MSPCDPDFIKFNSIFGICCAAVIFGFLFLIESPGPVSYIASPILILSGVIGFRRYWKSI
jgi:hypothetical protein